MSVAVVVGAGPGLGAALCRRFAAGGMRVAAARRDGEAAREVAETAGGRGYACDATDRTAVAELFRAVDRDLGTPELVVFNAGAFRPAGVLDIDPEEFERCWRIGCLGALHVGQEALRRMAERGRGTLILTGATAALRGGKGFANLAVPKFGLRALAQSMAREMHPQGVHVAHTIIDGQIRNDARGGRHAASERGEDALLEPDTIAEAYWQLHLQPKSAWTQELDLRPWVETF
jgi:NAD(P)-dependent dehydrogenase (short-subunit alcohol dehydrogenase family)